MAYKRKIPPLTLAMLVALILTGCGNSPPTVKITNPKDGAVIWGKTVEFRMEAKDPEGEELSIEWDFGDGTTCPPDCGAGTEQNPIHTCAPVRYEGQSYRVMLVVSDGKHEARDTINIRVSAPPPMTLTLKTWTALGVDTLLRAAKQREVFSNWVRGDEGQSFIAEVKLEDGENSQLGRIIKGTVEMVEILEALPTDSQIREIWANLIGQIEGSESMIEPVTEFLAIKGVRISSVKRHAVAEAFAALLLTYFPSADQAEDLCQRIEQALEPVRIELEECEVDSTIARGAAEAFRRIQPVIPSFSSYFLVPYLKDAASRPSGDMARKVLRLLEADPRTVQLIMDGWPVGDPTTWEEFLHLLKTYHQAVKEYQEEMRGPPSAMDVHLLDGLSTMISQVIAILTDLLLYRLLTAGISIIAM